MSVKEDLIRIAEQVKSEETKNTEKLPRIPSFSDYTTCRENNLRPSLHEIATDMDNDSVDMSDASPEMTPEDEPAETEPELDIQNHSLNTVYAQWMPRILDKVRGRTDAQQLLAKVNADVQKRITGSMGQLDQTRIGDLASKSWLSN